MKKTKTQTKTKQLSDFGNNKNYVPIAGTRSAFGDIVTQAQQDKAQAAVDTMNNVPGARQGRRTSRVTRKVEARRVTQRANRTLDTQRGLRQTTSVPTEKEIKNFSAAERRAFEAPGRHGGIIGLARYRGRGRKRFEKIMRDLQNRPASVRHRKDREEAPMQKTFNFDQAITEAFSLLMEKKYVRAYKNARARGLSPRDAVSFAKGAATDDERDSDTLADNPADRPKAVRSAFRGIPPHEHEDEAPRVLNRRDRLSGMDQTDADMPLRRMVRDTARAGLRSAGRQTAQQRAMARDSAETGTTNKKAAAKIRAKKAKKLRRELGSLMAREPRRKELQSKGPINVADVKIDTVTRRGSQGMPRGVGPKGMYASTQIIGKTLVENFKKVCWGKRYDEATPEPGMPGYNDMMRIRSEKNRSRTTRRKITPIEVERILSNLFRKTPLGKTWGISNYRSEKDKDTTINEPIPSISINRHTRYKPKKGKKKNPRTGDNALYLSTNVPEFQKRNKFNIDLDKK